jgi:hypothetical protein
MGPREESALLRSFALVCPFCEDSYPFPEDIGEVYRCRCGALFKIAWRSDMEDTVSQLASSFLQDGVEEKNTLGDALLCQAVVYQDIENIMRMKREYEEHKLLRSFQGFDRDYLQKLVLVWLGCEGQGSHPLDAFI